MQEKFRNISKSVYSSYHQNNIGETLFDIVLTLKPRKIIEIGVLEGYSTLAMAQALRILGKGTIKGYDLFEDYQYRNCPLEKVRENVREFKDIVSFEKKAWEQWEGEDFDLLHFDISNDGHKIRQLERKTREQRSKGAVVIFEGGTKQRDEVAWMKQYKKLPISESGVLYEVINKDFPSLSML